MRELGRKRNWTWVSLDVGKFRRGRVWKWVTLDVGEFKRRRKKKKSLDGPVQHTAHFMSYNNW